MTAREMFEQKDFEYGENENAIIYQKKYKEIVELTIIFDKRGRDIAFSGLRMMNVLVIRHDWMKAIIQQCKELGWFDE